MQYTFNGWLLETSGQRVEDGARSHTRTSGTAMANMWRDVMKGPLYKLWMVELKNSWYQLSHEEQEHHLDKVRQALAEVGAKSMITIESVWSNERWQYFGVEEFPDIEAVQRFAKLLQEMSHFRYFRTRSILGTKQERS
jgi:hypothetical protein